MSLVREEARMGDFKSPDPIDEVNRIQDNPPERVIEDETDDDGEGGTILEKDDEIGRDKQLDR